MNNIGKSLTLPQRRLNTFDVKFSKSDNTRPSTITHFDRNGDGKVDAVLISEDHFFKKTDAFITFDDQMRQTSSVHAENGVVTGKSNTEWQTATTGRRSAEWDKSRNGVADHGVEHDVSKSSSPASLRWSELAGFSTNVIATHHYNKDTIDKVDSNGDGQLERK